MSDGLNRRGFEGLVRTHGPELHHYCMGLLGGRRALADEVLQYTFEVAWSRRADFTGGNARAWLYAIARRQGLYRLRTEGRFVSVGPEALQRLLGGAPPDEGGIEAPVKAQLMGCFEGLESADRTIVQVAYGLRPAPPELCLGEDPTYGEIGRLLDREEGGRWSEDRVRMRLKRALAKLLLCMGAIKEDGDA